MKVINNGILTFTDNTDTVKTEKTVYEKVLQDFDSLPDDFNYVDLPLADAINKTGYNFQYVQKIITDIENQYPNTIKRYVCQHIYVNHINFYNNKVYTPHTLTTDSKIVIPHYNPTIHENDFIPFKNREFKSSFVGCLATHPIRSQLAKFNNNKDIIVRETGRWHFEKEKKEQQKYSNKYKEILCNSKFCFCPPGTGVSTIRLYESMAAGCVPIILNDVKVPKIVEKHIIRLYNIDDISNIEWENPKYELASNKLKNLYWKHLSNINFYKLLYD